MNHNHRWGWNIKHVHEVTDDLFDGDGDDLQRKKMARGWDTQRVYHWFSHIYPYFLEKGTHKDCETLSRTGFGMTSRTWEGAAPKKHWPWARWKIFFLRCSQACFGSFPWLNQWWIEGMSLLGLVFHIACLIPFFQKMITLKRWVTVLMRKLSRLAFISC